MRAAVPRSASAHLLQGLHPLSDGGGRNPGLTGHLRPGGAGEPQAHRALADLLRVPELVLGKLRSEYSAPEVAVPVAHRVDRKVEDARGGVNPNIQIKYLENTAERQNPYVTGKP